MGARQFAKIRSTSRLCGSADLWTAIPLQPLPIASPNVGDGISVTELAPADVRQCESCGHLQLAAVVDPEFHYRNFRYVTGISLGLREHFEGLITGLSADREIMPGKFVVDIGSNDGSLLRYAKRYTDRILGIDPAEEIAKVATESGIPTLADFFNAELAKKIVQRNGRADVVISNNTVANIDDLDGFFAGIDLLLADDGILIIETQYGLDVLTRTLLDVIYHEHISYFVVRPFRDFLKRRGFSLAGAERIAPKGGSIRFKIQRAAGRRPIHPGVDELIRLEIRQGLYDKRLFGEFNQRVSEVGKRIRALLKNARGTSGRCFAYGASVGCAALIHYFELCEIIDIIFDDNPLISAMRTARGEIPINAGRLLAETQPSDVIVLAWRYAHVIARGQADFREKGGRFFAALPDLTFVDGSDLTGPAA
jgi:2-polyprenyl-3-methyl-5-hydroxy-6-metoxy-1,4-benzoquinol methylase